VLVISGEKSLQINGIWPEMRIFESSFEVAVLVSDYFDGNHRKFQQFPATDGIS
jgi:hypothetical protein